MSSPSPSSSPSKAALMKRPSAAKDDSWEMVKGEVRQLLGNKDYLILFTVFSIGVGFFNAIFTLLNQLVAPFGYRQETYPIPP